MHTRTLKKLALALTLWLAVHTPTLRAQILGPYTNNSTGFEVNGNGLLSEIGTNTATLSLSGAGTRMFWYPDKAAFRAGGVDAGEWDDANIGPYSVAFGIGTTASGSYATAFGYHNMASGNGSTSSGCYSTASGRYSVAFGDSVAYGDYSTALGWGLAYGGWSMAWGGSTASGYYGTAWGRLSLASGTLSTASGYWTQANGNYSTASGLYTTASAYADFVVGAFNTGLSSTGGASDPNSWNPNDPLFEIGNGESNGWGNPYASGPSDALVVYKNGNAQLEGTLRCSAGGDLSMGAFTQGTNPALGQP